MSAGALTEKQERALRALADPLGRAGTEFWHDARASWAGPRRTLGSLLVRGLAEYRDELGVGPRWTITGAGVEILLALDRSRP